MKGTGLSFLRRMWKHLKDSRGIINTTDLMLAAGGTVILAAVVSSVSLPVVDQAKLAKSQADAQALKSAMHQFFKDTGKWPGQAEVAATGTSAVPAKTPIFLTTALDGTFPTFAGEVFTTGVGTCKGNSLEGFASGVTIAASASNPTSFDNFRNINDYLVRKPDTGLYPNWRGPYLQAEIEADPFGTVWLINTLPLFCAEDVTVTGGASDAGNLGYAWIVTGGPNRTLTTTLKSANLEETGDDAGVSLSKLTTTTKPSGF